MNQRDIFSAALDIEDPAERSAYLDRVCVDDPALRQRVAALVGAHKPASSFLERPAGDLLATVDQPPIAEKPGTIIGPYKLLQQIGEGGMGAVYMAEQTEPVRRRVALKIIKPGMDSRQVIARFEAERQALAMMDHQNIARVLDAGTTDSGRPYFVMELVNGVPVTRYCDENKLTPRERLELFVPVCQAVQHAHQKGVIHRDLKPSNIMVTLYDGKPAPKVIDFGVAKATEQRLTERTLFTQYGTIVGTMEYMAPEQAEMSALGVDTRSDVYSLGVLLYELLTGTTPLERGRLRGAALDEMMRLIREEEPPRPSARISTSGQALAAISQQRATDAAKLAQTMRGELDWIVMKALEKDRTRRYDSASGLARDIQRHLADEAVEACPPTLGYRLHKFVRKNKKPLTATAAFALLLLAGIAASGWQAIRATRAEEHAIADRDDADKARAAETEQRGIAVTERNQAQDERNAANAARMELRRTHYAVSMNLIQSAWESDNLGRVLELLDDLRPKSPDEPDLRGFEWHYWDRLCHAERRALPLEGLGRVQSLSLSADGSRMAGELVVADGDKKDTVFVKVWDTASGREVRSWRVETSVNRRWTLALNQDGSRLAVCYAEPAGRNSTDAQVQVWEVASGKVLFTRKELFIQLAISPDGKLLATVDGKFVAKVWDLAAPDREPVVVEGPVRGILNELKFSPDGTRLAVAAQNGPRQRYIRLWDTTTGKVRTNLAADDSLGNAQPCMAFSPDGNRLAAVQRVQNSEPKSYLWERTAGDEFKLLRETPIALAGIHPRVAFSPDGLTLAAWTTGILGGTEVKLLDSASGAERQLVRGHVDGIESVAFSADGTRLITAGLRNGSQPSGPLVKEWDLVPAALQRPASVTVQSPVGDRLAVYEGFLDAEQNPDSGSEVTIRDRAGKEIVVFRGHTGRVTDVTFSPDGRLVVSRVQQSMVRSGQRVFSTQIKEVRIWETDTGKLRWPTGQVLAAPVGPGAWAQPFSPDGRVLALPEQDGVKIVRTDDFQQLFNIGNTANRRFSPNGRRLVAWYRNPVNPDQPRPAGRPQGVMKLWDVDAGREIVSTPPTEVLPTIVFSPDSRFFACASLMASKDLTVWDAATGEQRISLKDTFAAHIAFSPDGSRLVTAPHQLSRTSCAAVWDLATGKVLHHLEGPAGIFMGVIFSPDGKRIVSASGRDLRTAEIKLWDAVTGRELLSLKAKRLPGYELAFSPDGHRLIRSTGNGFPDAQPDQVWDATPRAEKK
jgi:serine/threonine protein kinase/WD40 repeat protein